MIEARQPARAINSVARMWVAIVCGLDGVRFLCGATSRSSLNPAIAEHVRRSASGQLWPDQTAAVEHLLATGAIAQAIDLYFAVVGDRWDAEWLHIEKIDPYEPPDGTGADDEKSDVLVSAGAVPPLGHGTDGAGATQASGNGRGITTE